MKYEIGARIKKYREEQSISQKQLAMMIGVTNNRLSNWEQGINRPDIDNFANICTALRVSPSELLDFELQPQNLTQHENLVIVAYRTHPDMNRAVDILLGLADNK